MTRLFDKMNLQNLLDTPVDEFECFDRELPHRRRPEALGREYHIFLHVTAIQMMDSVGKILSLTSVIREIKFLEIRILKWFSS